MKVGLFKRSEEQIEIVLVDWPCGEALFIKAMERKLTILEVTVLEDFGRCAHP